MHMFVLHLIVLRQAEIKLKNFSCKQFLFHIFDRFMQTILHEI